MIWHNPKEYPPTKDKNCTQILAEFDLNIPVVCFWDYENNVWIGAVIDYDAPRRLMFSDAIFCDEDMERWTEIPKLS